ncbi:HK97 family phage portal protein [Laceyella sacchari]|uniref:phage portal protein n=1 Tax=Laceyella sacchari TaxID=37482 RepID=UPI000B2844FB|nr:phage portal protein [Laceyella sacchari]TCW35306.1 HK97 family phage portal protein [Laceyella sacchari]
MDWKKWIQRKGLGTPIWTDISGVSDTENKYHLTEIGYRVNSLSSACINLIATSLSEAPLKIYRRQPNGEDIELESHWLKKLIDHPNEHMSSFEMWEMLVIHLYTGGVAYILLDRQSERGPVERLRLLRPDLIEPIPDENLFISGYRYRPVLPNGQRAEITYPAYQVLRLPLPDPLNEHDGLSPLKRIYKELAIDNNATDFTRQFFSNSAVPFGILSTDQELMEEEAQAIEDRWHRKFSGYVKGLFRTAVLGKGAKYEQLGMNFKDMEFESLRALVETRICAAFKVHPVIVHSWVGIKYSEQRATYKEARRQFWEDSLIPILRRIEAKINSQLLIYEEGVCARFDLSEIQALQEDENEKSKRVVAEWEKGIIKLDEARAELGFSPVEGEYGQKFIFELNAHDPQIPEDMNKEEPPDNQQKGSFFLAENKANLKDFIRVLLSLQDVLIEKMKNALTKMFQRWKKGLNMSGNIDDIRNQIQAKRSEWEDEVRDVVEDFISIAAEQSSQEAAAYLGISLDQLNPEVLSFLDRYIPKFAQSMVETSITELTSLVAKAQEEGWAITKLRDEIRAKFNQYSEAKAEMIARSEIIRSSNAGAKATYKWADIRQIQWVDTDDKRTCPFCKALDGKIIGIEENFLDLDQEFEATDNDGKQVRMKASYEPVGHPPLHPSCRCTIVPVID